MHIAYRKILVTLLLAVMLAVLILPTPALASEYGPPSKSGIACEVFYTVKSGDTLFKISNATGTPALVIIRLNLLSNPNLIYPGDVLCVKSYVAVGSFYVIHSGDTLTAIAKRYGFDIFDLATANGIKDPNIIYSGQVLFIPN